MEQKKSIEKKVDNPQNMITLVGERLLVEENLFQNPDNEVCDDFDDNSGAFVDEDSNDEFEEIYDKLIQFDDKIGFSKLKMMLMFKSEYMDALTDVFAADLMIFVQNLLTMKKEFSGKPMWSSLVSMLID